MLRLPEQVLGRQTLDHVSFLVAGNRTNDVADHLHQPLCQTAWEMIRYK